MTFSDHIAPVLAMILVWFASTGLIAWAANRPRRTFGVSLILGGVAGIAGLAAIVGAMGMTSPAGAYISFAGALAIWGWHELAFLTGAVMGPRRGPASDAPTRWQRFAEGTAAIIHHELALAATLVLLATLTWAAPNRTGAEAFALLFILRLSTKLNLHVGVPNFSDELLPPHLQYLKTYFRRRPFGLALAVSIVGTIALAAWLGWRAAGLAPGTGAATGASLLFGLAALGALEHIFVALPLRDGVLWRWALPAQSPNEIRGGGYGL